MGAVESRRSALADEAVMRLEMGLSSKQTALQCGKNSILWMILSPWPIRTLPPLTAISILSFRWSLVSPAWYTFFRSRSGNFSKTLLATLSYLSKEPKGSYSWTKSMPTVFVHPNWQTRVSSSSFYTSEKAFRPKKMKPTLISGWSLATAVNASSKTREYDESPWVFTRFPWLSY